MKKMVTLVLAIAMLMSLATVASAGSDVISLSVYCNSTTNYSRIQPGLYNYSNNHSIYVLHHDNVDTDEYTNHFRGQEAATANGPTWTQRGSKWVTQYLDIPIENNNIVIKKYYTVSARGNTNYYNYDGLSRITLSVQYDPNNSNRTPN